MCTSCYLFSPFFFPTSPLFVYLFFAAAAEHKTIAHFATIDQSYPLPSSSIGHINPPHLTRSSTYFQRIPSCLVLRAQSWSTQPETTTTATHSHKQPSQPRPIVAFLFAFFLSLSLPLSTSLSTSSPLQHTTRRHIYKSMATETVIYVSLALVLLTRIYVFISPPEFLEQYKDRQYHEYHLYRQYHIRKQIDNGDDKEEQPQEGDDLAALLQSHSRRRSSSSTHQQEQHGHSDGGFVDPSPLTALHYPSDELVLLGMGPGARPLPLGDLSAAGFSKFEDLTVNTTTSLSTVSPLSTTASTVAAATATTTGSLSSSPYSPRDGGEKDVWKHIMGASETGATPSYLSLDASEIHYNGSLHRFEKDPEVLESITALKAGQRDMAKECPVMTVVWEGGRWCCLEGRTLYILRALEWRGQVRVRVLVDKDPTTLAVTEECWKAAGMTSDLTPLFTTLGRKPSVSTTPTSAVFESTLSTVTEDEDVLRSKGSRVFMSTATADPNATTIGLSLEDDSTFGGRILIGTPEVEANVRFSSLSNSSKKRSSSLSGSHSGNDADVEEYDESRPGSDDGYMEDDEGETEEDEGSFSEDDQDHHRVRSRLQAMSLHHHPSTATATRQRQQQQQQHRMLQPLTSHQDESENNSDLTMVSPPSPVFTPLSAIQLPSDPIRKQSFGSTTLPGGGVVHHPRTVSSSQRPHRQHQHLHQHHERKISIPEFMLPPPLHDEQVYLIVDPSTTVGATKEEEEAAVLLREKNPPRRDSGHGDSS